MATHADCFCAVYVDMGTTNTRAWLMHANQIIAATTESTGIRDAAREGQSVILECLRRVITKLRAFSSCTSEYSQPGYVVGVGMIGSNLGLAEVPYVSPPVTLAQLSAGARWYRFPDLSNLPLLLAPGVRSGPQTSTVGSISQTDVMRGEETLCAGLLSTGAILAPVTVMNLGSHWKAIQIDPHGRIQASETSLSGELLHALQCHTVLAGSVARKRPRRFKREWIEAGMSEHRRSGLGRALFCTRLLDLAREGSTEDRLAFVVGALIASDLDSLLARGAIGRQAQLALVGHTALAEAWQIVLSQADISAHIISAEQAEIALLEAMHRILIAAAPALESASSHFDVND